VTQARLSNPRGNGPTHSPNQIKWNIGVDTGGTFTDCVARHSDGRIARAKVLSTSAFRGVVRGGSKDSLVIEFASGLLQENVAGFFTGFVIRAVDGEVNRYANGAVTQGQNSTRDIAQAKHVHVEAAHLLQSGHVEFQISAAAPTRNTTNQKTSVIQGENPVSSRAVDAHEMHPTGSFVDCIAPFEAPILAARIAIGRPLPLPLDDCRICIGTTRGTNALLQGRVSPVTLFVNDGLQDILRIGDQRRLDIFACAPRKPSTLEKSSVGVNARMTCDGNELTALDENALRFGALNCDHAGNTIAAVALLHAAVNPAHEIRVAQLLRDQGFTWVSLSHQCGSTSRFEPRARAAVVDAALSGPVGEFIKSIENGASGADIFMMTSAGGLTPVSAFAPRESLLSGPAGGVASAGDIARECGFTRCVTLDMGGTSTDVARVDGSAEMCDETKVGAATIASPCVAVESVAAGGGSILWWDGEAKRVGPQSAGAVPGPACYGAGGPLTLTDAHFILGHIHADMMPIPMSLNDALKRAHELHAAITQHNDLNIVGGAEQEQGAAHLKSTTKYETVPMKLHEMLHDFIGIADEAMAAAIRTVTVRKGVDPTTHALVAFGGAGGLHACAIAQQLGMENIVLPADAGLLCASGISQAPVTRVVWELVLQVIGDEQPSLHEKFAQLFERAKKELLDIGMDASTANQTRRVALMRLKGQEESLEIELPLANAQPLNADRLRELFKHRFHETYGFLPDTARAIELERLRLQVEITRTSLTRAKSDANTTTEIVGPTVLSRAHSTAFVAAGWRASTHESGSIILSRDRSASQSTRTTAHSHELIAARLGSIATDMGEQLRRTAVSPNIKDRLDFSCGLLDADGFLVVNAPHIPIHLGALGVCVREVGKAHAFAPGQVWVVNHPRFGGSHLPDLTVITPIFSKANTNAANAELIGFAANRAHHAEMGGTRPGSMPPDATALAHEGVVIEPTLIVEKGVAHLDRVERQLRGSEWPSRMVADNLADISAQIAANELAVARMRELVACNNVVQPAQNADRQNLLISQSHLLDHPPLPEQSNLQFLRTTCEKLRESARRAAERALQLLPDVIAPLEERLDDGTVLRVQMRRLENPPRLVIDFTGTSPQHAKNLNAPQAVTRAAVMYSIRVLVGQLLGGITPAFPMNEGLLDPIEIILPAGTILSPNFSGAPDKCPACAIGQTETSQRLVDLLWRAFNLAACSQGTINNLLFGNERFGFYETIAGGAGATASGDGESGVHTHISNTRITDAEVLERRYPVRLEQFSIRHNSGGAGNFCGGDGLVRRLRFLEAVDLSFLSQHRIEAPYGMNGGDSGACGEQKILRADGRVEELPGIVAARIEAGDAIEIQTPGGGGFGKSGGA
jgi:5-oxoprolinase (ATP-hydrolysing)